MVLQLPQSGLYMGIVFPQAWQGVCTFFGIFAVVVRIVFVIFSFSGEMP